MHDLRMTRTAYTGELWQGAAVHPELWRMLQQEDLLIEITSGQAPQRIVLGVPHHAGPGVVRIAERWHNPRTGRMGRTADEATGLAGLAVFTALQEKGVSCKLVIAAHPTDHDPNKTPGSPYWNSIFAAPYPRLLFELHGMANHRRNDLELSAGQNAVAHPMDYGRLLAHFWNQAGPLAVQRRSGSAEGCCFVRWDEVPGRLQNPALGTHSLAHAGKLGIPALHLEMKSGFRRPDPLFPRDPQPTDAIWTLAHALANTLEIMTRPDHIYISATDLGLNATAFLARPSLEYEESFLAAVHEASQHELLENPDLRVENHQAFLDLVNGCAHPIFSGLPKEPIEEYLWLIDQGEVIGRAYFLHWLSDFRRNTDGQVDYWIRPSKRRKGYGRLILRLLLERFRQLGLSRILISCLESNMPSQKIIKGNGGVYESTIQTPDLSGQPEDRRRYWIDL